MIKVNVLDLGMNLQMDVVPLFEKAASKLVLRSSPDMFLQGENNHLFCGQDPLSQPFHSGGALRLSSKARGHQWTFPAQFMSQRMLNLSWSMADGDGLGRLRCALEPHCSSELGNSTTVSAQSGTGQVTLGVTWLTFVHALRLDLDRLQTQLPVFCSFLLIQILLEEERNWRYFGNSVKLGVMIRKSQCREVLSCYQLPYYMKGMKEMNIVTGS